MSPNCSVNSAALAAAAAEMDQLAAELSRQAGDSRAAGQQAAGALREALPPRCRLVALDERGADLTTRALAERLRRWMAGGQDVALVIGGPDGLAPEIKAAAAETLRLSSLTLPHALVRVVLAEALYRAASLLKNHPYHRE